MKAQPPLTPAIVAALAGAALAGWCSPVLAQADAGPTAPTACGPIDDKGACYGDVAAWCSEPNPNSSAALAPTERFDCSAIVVDGRPIPAACVQLGTFGAWCGVDVGERCIVPSVGGDRQLACLNGGIPAVDGACDLIAGCRTGVQACAGAERVCVGSFLQIGCGPFGQARGVDCAAIGGDCSDAACTGIVAGEPCDGASLLCADGLSCVGAESALGVCLTADETAEPSLPEEEAPRESAPSCSGAGGGSGGGHNPLTGLSASIFLFCFSILRRRIRR